MEEHTARKLAVILHADVVGSTGLVQRNETLAHERIRDAFHHLSVTIGAYAGIPHEIRGDALVAEFARASDAVSAALAFQTRNAELNSSLDDDLQSQIRIGISMGEVVIADDTVTGAGVVLAQRVEQLAEPDGLCITAAIHETIPQHLPFDYSSLGKQEVKGFDEPVQVYRASLKTGEIPPPDVAISQSPSTKRMWYASAVALLVVVSVALAWWQPWQPREEPASLERMAFSLPSNPSIAVMPFDVLSEEPEQGYLGDGLTNDIITALSRFGNMFVIASHSSFVYKNKPVKMRTVSEELGVRYILEGSVQKSLDQLRVNTRLIDALSGRQLWAEKYDSQMTDLLAIQDEIVANVVANLAIKVDAVERERVRGKTTNSLDAYDYYLRAADIRFDWDKGSNKRTRQLLEKAIGLDSEYARAYAALAWTHVNDWRWGWTEDFEESKQLALAAARKAVELDPFDPEGHHALGIVHLYNREFDKAIPLYEKAIALNPNDARRLVGTAPAWIYVGRTHEAVSQMERGLRLNPHHSDNDLNFMGWAYFEAKEYEKALATLKRVEKSVWRKVLAATYVRLGRIDDARTEVAIVMEKDPAYSIERGKAFPYKDEAQRKHYYDALAEAGVPEHPPLPLPKEPSIAVLPFDNLSNDPEQEYFADGMTDDLITDLSKISGLFVIARNSTFAYKSKPVDVKQVAVELGVRYVLEGSVRRAGNQVRINAQLIDATTGGHLWADRYDGSIADIFAVQDSVTRKIVGALAINLTPENRKLVAQGGTTNVTAYDAFLQGWERYRRRTPGDLVEAVRHFEGAIEADAEYGRAYAALAIIYWKSWLWSVMTMSPAINVTWTRRLQIPLVYAPDRAREYLEMAMNDPTPLAYQVASEMSWRDGDYDKAISQAETAIALNSNDPVGHLAMAEALIYDGRPKMAEPFVQKATRLDPHSAVNLYLLGLARFSRGELEEAAALFERAVTRSPFSRWWNVPLAAAYAHLDRDQDARRALSEWAGAISFLEIVELWPFRNRDVAERFATGVTRAGVCCDEDLKRYLSGLRQ